MEPTEVLRAPSNASFVGVPTVQMKAAAWMGKRDIQVIDVPKPNIVEPKDAVVRITATTICGSDLHLYHGEMGGRMALDKGYVFGHEFVGIVESIGNQVSDIKVGDKVVVSAVIAEGNCEFCKRGLFSCCDVTNTSKEMEEHYGQKIAGVFGYSKLMGGYQGGQAEYCRVPLADMNCLKVPNDLPDQKVLLLSDVACTGWHANEMGEVSEGQDVAIWGCGPVGLMSAMWAKFRGAKTVVSIDTIPYRLEFAKRHLGVVAIDASKENVTQRLKELFPRGLDVCIDAVGFRYTKGFVHSLEKSLKIETDSPEILNECILAAKKAGKVSIVGDYFAWANQFLIGAMMEKGLTMRGSQVHVQRYWKQLLQWIQEGKVNPDFIFTHTMPLEEASQAYKMFDQKTDNCIKILLKPNPVVLSK
jgi:threonine dehydrogenase-like Zn-dependent dehydrogenase